MCPAWQIHAEEPTGNCQAWSNALEFHPALPATRHALREGAALTLVALGSSTTEGAGANAQDESYPAEIGEQLERRLPDHRIIILNEGIGGQTAYEMLQRMDEDVIARRPTLLIWDTVITDTLRDVGQARLARTLRKGIGKAREAGIDILLMDMQWLPHEDRYPNYDDYRKTFRKTAAELGVAVIPRYDLMKIMARSEMFALPDQSGTDVLQLTDSSNHCLAILVSEAIAGEQR